MKTNSERINTDLERATQIVTEIIRCSGGRVDCKTRLFKIFYFAHLMYAQDSPDYLSEWPIVRMPRGPGIGNSEMIFSAMQREGLLEVRQVAIGPYTAFEYRTNATDVPPLPLEAIEAIRRAVEFTKDKNAAELSELTHQFSNSWKDTTDGQLLNIYADLLSEEAYADMKQRGVEGLADLKAVFG